MSKFAVALDDLIARKKLKAADIARISGIGDSMISRYRSGDVKEIPPPVLLKLATAITNEPAEQGELVRGHLWDECPAQLRKTVDIAVRGEKEFREKATSYKSEAEEVFAVLQDNWDDNDVKDLLKGLASLLTRGTSRIE